MLEKPEVWGRPGAVRQGSDHAVGGQDRPPCGSGRWPGSCARAGEGDAGRGRRPAGRPGHHHGLGPAPPSPGAPGMAAPRARLRPQGPRSPRQPPLRTKPRRRAPRKLSGMSETVSFYEAVGGEETFNPPGPPVLPGAFATDPVLRPVYPARDPRPGRGAPAAVPHAVLGRAAHLRRAARAPQAADAARPVRHRRGRARRLAAPHASGPWTNSSWTSRSPPSSGTTWSWPRTAWSTWTRHTGARTSG